MQPVKRTLASFATAVRDVCGCATANTSIFLDEDAHEPGDPESGDTLRSSTAAAAAAFVEVDLLRHDRNRTRSFPDNSIRTAKYTLLSGLPLSILYQFYKVSNCYFLLVMIITLVPGASPINPFSSIVPLCIVLGAGILKDLWEDWARRKADRLANEMTVYALRPRAQTLASATGEDGNDGGLTRDRGVSDASPNSALPISEATALTGDEVIRHRGERQSHVPWATSSLSATGRPAAPGGDDGGDGGARKVVSHHPDCTAKPTVTFEAIRSCDVYPGDVLLFRLGEEVRADCVILNTSLPDGLTYIETAQLDGETSAKTRRAKIQTVEALGTVESIVEQALSISADDAAGVHARMYGICDAEPSPVGDRAPSSCVSALKRALRDCCGLIRPSRGGSHHRPLGHEDDVAREHEKGTASGAEALTASTAMTGTMAAAAKHQRERQVPLGSGTSVPYGAEVPLLLPPSSKTARSGMEPFDTGALAATAKPSPSVAVGLPVTQSPPSSPSLPQQLSRQEEELWRRGRQNTVPPDRAVASRADLRERHGSDAPFGNADVAPMLLQQQQQSSAPRLGGAVVNSFARSRDDLSAQTSGSIQNWIGSNRSAAAVVGFSNSTAATNADTAPERIRHERLMTFDERLEEDGLLPLPRPQLELSEQYERRVLGRSGIHPHLSPHASTSATHWASSHAALLTDGTENSAGFVDGGDDGAQPARRGWPRSPRQQQQQRRRGLSSETRGSVDAAAYPKGPSHRVHLSASDHVTGDAECGASAVSACGSGGEAASQCSSVSTHPADSSGGGVVVIACAPTPDLSAWFGQLRLPSGEMVPLGIDQFLPRGCLIRNTDWVMGAVIYTGRHTKMQLNLRPKPHKMTDMTRRLNHLNIFLFILNQTLMLLLCGMAIWFKHHQLQPSPGAAATATAWYIRWSLERYSDVKLFGWRYLTNFVLLSYLIPMSLYVTLEFNRAMQMLMIGADKRLAVFDEFSGAIKLARPKTSDLNCQLGHVRYIFTDKTGTLTENLMTYVGGVVEGQVHNEVEQPGGIGRALLRRWGRGEGGGGDGSLAFMHHGLASANSRSLMSETVRSRAPPAQREGCLDQTPPGAHLWRERDDGTAQNDRLVNGSRNGFAAVDAPRDGGSVGGPEGLQHISEAVLETDPLFRYLRALSLCHSVVCFPADTGESDTTAVAAAVDGSPSAASLERMGPRHRHRARSSGGVREAASMSSGDEAHEPEGSRRRHLSRFPDDGGKGSDLASPGLAAEPQPPSRRRHRRHRHHHKKDPAHAAHQQPYLFPLSELSARNFVEIPYAVPAGPEAHEGDGIFPATPPMPAVASAAGVSGMVDDGVGRGYATTAAAHRPVLSRDSVALWGRAGANEQHHHPFSPSLSAYALEKDPALPALAVPVLSSFKEPPQVHGKSPSQSHGRTGCASWYQNRYFHHIMHSRNWSTQLSRDELAKEGGGWHDSRRADTTAAVYKEESRPREGDAGDSKGAMGGSGGGAAPHMSFAERAEWGGRSDAPSASARPAMNVSGFEQYIDYRKLYEGHSLDEIALVNAARENGFSLFERTAKQLFVKALGRVLCYDILAELEFTPQRKLMSILLQRRPDLDSEEAATLAMAGTTAHYHRQQPTVASDDAAPRSAPLPPAWNGEGEMEGGDTSDAAPGRAELDSQSSPLTWMHSGTVAEQESGVAEAGVNGHRRPFAGGPWGSATHRQGAGGPCREPFCSAAPAAAAAAAAATPKYLLLVKGADSSMLEIANKPQHPAHAQASEKTLKELDAMAKLGLRTLLLGQRYLNETEVRAWLPVFHEAQCSMQSRSEKLHEAYALLERDIDLVGATAVEDKLQEEVPQTLEFCIEASIVVWMLTGDKRETAVTIAHTSGLISAEHSRSVCHLDVSDILEEEAIVRQHQRHQEQQRRHGQPGGPPAFTGLLSSSSSSPVTLGGATGPLSCDTSSALPTSQGMHGSQQWSPGTRSPEPGSLRTQPDILYRSTAASSTEVPLPTDGTRGAPPQTAPSFEQRKCLRIEAQLRAAEEMCDVAQAVLGTEAVVIVVDGKTLDFIFADADRALRFFRLGSRCRSAVCCRMTPLQKAKIVRLFKQNMNAVALAIGDGANDVSMIQESSIGVGIMGLEGSQAELASDYALPKFRFLKRLLFVHGRFSVFREAHCIVFSLYKNVIITVGMISYQFYVGFSGQPLIDSWLLAIFSIFCCSLQPLLIGVFDKDVEDELAESLPKLYPPLSHEFMYFSYRYIAKWLLDGLVEGLLFFFFLVYAVGVHDHLYSEKNGAVEDYGMTFFTMMVLVADLRVGTLVTYYMIPFVAVIAAEILLVPVIEVVYSAMHNLAGSNWCVFIAQELYSASGRFWLMLLFACGVLIVYSIAMNMYIQLFAPWQNANIAMHAAHHSPHRVPYKHLKKDGRLEYARLLTRYEELTKAREDLEGNVSPPDARAERHHHPPPVPLPGT